jgi:dienelactone hydrolase
MKRLVSFLLFCLCVSSALLAQTLKTLPLPTGSFQVGIAKYDLNDPNRKQIEYPKGRLIPIEVYFPMGVGKPTQHSKIYEDRSPQIWPPLEVEVYGQQADISRLSPQKKHPLILLNHGDAVAMTDYAAIAEDLASQGYVVVAIQHQLKTDPAEPAFWNERSISKYGNVIDNLLYVYEWLKENQTSLFKDNIDFNKVGFIGHSMGGNSLLLFANRASNILKKKQSGSLLPHGDNQAFKEAIIVLDSGGFPFPSTHEYPLFLLFAEEKEEYQKKSGAYEAMVKAGHKVKYYKGAKHVSFMDHGYVDPKNPLNPNEHYFNGSVEERKAFFDLLRQDIRTFLKDNGIQ